MHRVVTTAPKAMPGTNQMRAALAKDSYRRNIVRIGDPDLRGFDWLVTSPQGVFAVNDHGFKLAIFGWFFGICRQDEMVFLFENCGHRDRREPRGRLVRMSLRDGRLSNAIVIATGLDCSCHQIAVIDDMLHVLDTANQAILRYRLDGRPIDVLRPLDNATNADPAGYHHINAIVQVGERIGVMLHNGVHQPPTTSAIAWFNQDWQEVERQALSGTSCHDLVTDDDGHLWHADSMAGDVVASDGRRITLSREQMTRGIAFRRDRVIVGLSTFGPRQRRDAIRGTVGVYDRQFQPVTQLILPGPPCAIIALPQ